MLWNVGSVEPPQVARETSSTLGEFVNANIWIVNEITAILNWKKEKMAFLEEY